MYPIPPLKKKYILFFKNNVDFIRSFKFNFVYLTRNNDKIRNVMKEKNVIKDLKKIEKRINEARNLALILRIKLSESKYVNAGVLGDFVEEDLEPHFDALLFNMNDLLGTLTD
jgi:hypothetical protein